LPNQENDDQFAELKIKTLEKTIYFIRHGESVANAGGITMKNRKIPLSAKGFEQARSVAENFKIKPSQILVSEYLRTHQTAEPFYVRNSSEYQICTKLNEFSIISHELNDTVLFGHGIWFGMLLWKLMGFAANDRQSMIGFRRFQNGLPISNCIIYRLHSVNDSNWSVCVHNVEYE
jgi:alpha-ribazole phosphatase